MGSGNSTIYNAVEGSVAQIQELVAQATVEDVNYVESKTGDTPLLRAIRNGNETVAVFLLTNPVAKASPLMADFRGTTPLHCAAQRGMLNVMRILKQVALGGSLDTAAQDVSGNTPLMIAVQAQQLGSVQCLLQDLGPASLHIDVQNKNGFTAIMHAARLGRLDIVEMLARAGANLKLKNLHGNTVFKLTPVNPKAGVTRKDIVTRLMSVVDEKNALEAEAAAHARATRPPLRRTKAKSVLARRFTINLSALVRDPSDLDFTALDMRNAPTHTISSLAMAGAGGSMVKHTGATKRKHSMVTAHASDATGIRAPGGSSHKTVSRAKSAKIAARAATEVRHDTDDDDSDESTEVLEDHDEDEHKKAHKHESPGRRAARRLQRHATDTMDDIAVGNDTSGAAAKASAPAATSSSAAAARGPLVSETKMEENPFMQNTKSQVARVYRRRTFARKDAEQQREKVVRELGDLEARKRDLLEELSQLDEQLAELEGPRVVVQKKKKKSQGSLTPDKVALKNQNRKRYTGLSTMTDE